MNVLTVIGFAITIIAWFGITPRQIYKLATKQKILEFEKFDFILVAMSCVAIGGVVYFAITKSGSMWNYLQFSFLIFFPWLNKLGFAFVMKGKNKIFYGFVIISAILLQSYSIPAINEVLNGVRDNRYIFNSWVMIGAVLFGWLLSGVFIGFSFAFVRNINKLRDLTKRVESIEDASAKIKTLESIVKQSNKKENSKVKKTKPSAK
jgi:hypothetical protein